MICMVMRAVVFTCWSGLTFCNVVVINVLECTIIFQVTSTVIICINMRNCGVVRTNLDCVHFLE
jgi:hypothetical protein